MQPVQFNEIVDIAQYERIRPEFRQGVLRQKEQRRIPLGPNFTFLFENHDTVLYQVQEMMRVERIVEEKAIAHELKTYNELIPPAGGVAATLLIEYIDPAERAVWLKKLVGLENHISLQVGGLPPVPGRFDTRQLDPEKLSSVQYLEFHLEAAHREAWAGAGAESQVKLVCTHPAYQHAQALSNGQLTALAEDFRME